MNKSTFYLALLASMMLAAAASAGIYVDRPAQTYIVGQEKFVELGPRTAAPNVVLPVRHKTRVLRMPGVIQGAHRTETTPLEELRLAVDGATIVSFVITREGKTADIWIWRSSGSKVLDQASVEAIANSAYGPATVDGQPVDLQWRAAVGWISTLSETAHRLPDLLDPTQNICEFGLPGAIEACSNVIAALSGSKLGNAYYWRAIAHNAAGDRANAVADFTKALEFAPDDTDTLRRRGVVFELLNRHDAALADLTRAVALEPNDNHALLARALVSRQLGRNGDAENDYAVVLHNGPECSPVHPNKCSDYAHAVRDDDYAVSQKPTDADARSAACAERALLNQELDRALADCNAGLALVPDYAPLHSARAFVYLRQEHYADVLRELAQVPLPKSGPEALYIRGIAKLRTGDTDGGKLDLFKAEDMDPDIAVTMAYSGVKP